MDFKGQKLSDTVSGWIVTVFAILGAWQLDGGKGLSVLDRRRSHPSRVRMPSLVTTALPCHALLPPPGFLVGYALQDFALMTYIFGGGCALAAVATVPDWPAYNKHPVKWLPPKEGAGSGARRGGAGGSGGAGGGSGGSGGRKKKQAASWSNFWGMF